MKRQTAVRPPGILCLRIAKTTSSSVRSGCFSIRPNRKSACFSNGEMLPPRGLAAQRPVCRKHLTQITAVLALTANSSALGQDRAIREMSRAMGTSRRALICALAVAALWPTTARAQAFPNRPIRLIVPFAAGGAADLFGRALANALSAELGQQVVVEVRAGAGGLTGVDALAKSAPDGYTICLAGAAALSAIPFMVSKMPFDWRKDLALLTLAVRVPEVLIVHPALGVDTLDDFIAYARAHPGKINFGSAGAGSITHLAVELLKRETGIDLVHVPYRGVGPAVGDMLG